MNPSILSYCPTCFKNNTQYIKLLKRGEEMYCSFCQSVFTNSQSLEEIWNDLREKETGEKQENTKP